MSNPKKIERLDPATNLQDNDLLFASVPDGNDTFVSKKIRLGQISQFVRSSGSTYAPSLAIGPNTVRDTLLWLGTSSEENPSITQINNKLINGYQIASTDFISGSNAIFFRSNTINIPQNGILEFVVDTTLPPAIQVTGTYVNSDNSLGASGSYKVSERKSSITYCLMKQTGNSPSASDDIYICKFDMDATGNQINSFIPILAGTNVYVQARANVDQCAFTKQIMLYLFHDQAI